MSDRTLITPGRAFEQTVSSLNGQLAWIAKRIRWSSSTATDYDDAAQTLTVDDSSFLPPYTLTTVATFTLDPGRWVILGATSIQMDGADGVSYRNGLQIDTPTETLDLSWGKGFTRGAVEVFDQFVASATVNLATATTIDLNCYAATTGAAGNADAFHSRMTAVPA